MSNYALVLNCGSSSIKFAIIDGDDGDALLSGLAENLGNSDARIIVKYAGEKNEHTLGSDNDHRAALVKIEHIIKQHPELAQHLVTVGHRVVHGGETFTASVLVTDEVKQAIIDTSHMAPLHNPANLAGINNAQQAFPDIPHVAVFDTAFFQGMPKHAFVYALPISLYKEHGIRRYGFHGSSHSFVTEQAAKMLRKDISQCRFISAHLGNGCSVTAFSQGHAIDTSLGFTPLEGLVMGTRCGDIDPSIPAFLIEQLGYSSEQVTNLLNKESGLLGLSGLSNDCRTLEEHADKGHEGAKLALQIFCYRLAKYIGSYLVAVGGPLDALIFTGGIGENSATIRGQVISYLQHLGFAMDDSGNLEQRFGNCGEIHGTNSTPILVIPTNEEWVIANDALTFCV